MPAFSQGAAQAPALSKAAEHYLDHVLDLMQENALHAKEIDWPTVRRETLKRANGARTTAETYPAIYYAITQLKEQHSFLMVPSDLPEADKQRARAAVLSILMPYRKQRKDTPPPSPFRNRTEPAGHLVHLGAETFAYVVIPECGPRRAKWQDNFPDYQRFADSLHNIAISLDAAHPDGWIIDLRGNGGGDMWPMMAGIGLVLGEGNVGYFVLPDGSKNTWFYRAGKAGVTTGFADSVQEAVSGPPFALPGVPPVAVLIDSGTMSSGEAMAIAFAGRPRTRLFGTHTFGLTSANRNFFLSDGAMLILATSVEADRLNRIYEDGISPDVSFPEPPMLPDEANDTVLQAAESWLASLSTVARN